MVANQQWFDIEAMLQKLDQQEQNLSVEDQDFVESSAHDATLESPEVVGWEKTISSSLMKIKKPSIKLSSKTRSLLSIVTTAAILGVALWVLSVQYPEEAKSVTRALGGTFASISSTVSNNRSSQEIVIIEDEENVIDFDSDYSTWSPLADALDANKTSTGGSRADDLFADLWSGFINPKPDEEQTEKDIENFSGSWSLEQETTNTGSLASSWTSSQQREPDSTYQPDYYLPDVDLPSLSEFIKQISELMAASKKAHDNYLGNNSSNKAQLSVVYKSTKEILKSTTQAWATTRDNFDRYHTMKAMYDKVMK